MKRIAVLFLLSFVLFNVVFASSAWKLVYKGVYGPIEITYRNNDRQNEGIIYGLTPQWHPIVIPGFEQVLSVRSKGVCEPLNIAIKDDSGNVLYGARELPYAPYKDCLIPQDAGNISNFDFFTKFNFSAPVEKGKYTIQITDDNNIVLEEATFNVPGEDELIGYIHSSREINVSSGIYKVDLAVKYPLIVSDTSSGDVYLSVSGPDLGEVRSILNNLTVGIVYYSAPTPLEREGNVECSEDKCTQHYILPYSKTERIILEALQIVDEGGYSSVTSIPVSVIKKEDIDSIKSLTEEIYKSVEYYVDYYKDKDEQKYSSWLRVKGELAELKKEVEQVYIASERGDFKYSDLITLMDLIDNGPKKLSGIKGEIKNIGE